MAGRDDMETGGIGGVGGGESGASKRRLPIAGETLPSAGAKAVSEADIEAELALFEKLERERLGLLGDREQWKDHMLDSKFKAKDRATTTLLIGGLTMAHDFLIEGGLRGIGYQVRHMAVPDNEALRFGKEFGNRAQCNPTYYTVGNLVKELCELRDKHGIPTEEIIKNNIFLTAGACGPCRFGMYVTEYRKALRDAGFDGFRVMLFQQKGGFKQATGEEAEGLDLNPEFFITLVKGVVIGDVLNALAYRIRPYELEVGATDRALENAKRIIYAAFLEKTSLVRALWKARAEFAAVKVDKLRAKPKVSIIGEFWAMTTEGDGNYQMHRFLEAEGAEPDIQLVTAWLLYTIWEGRHDTKDRAELRGTDTSYYGLGDIDDTGVAKKMAILRVADFGARAIFQFYAHLAGLTNYHLPNMDEIAEVSEKYYSNDLRGGEGHMEVGKLILNSLKKKAHMTVSVKPFGCMPSASVSDGVQSMITEKFPGSIYCAVETSGDGRVNFYSRIQMYLFKARAAADAELEATLAQYGLTKGQVQAFLDAHPKYASSLYKADHTVNGSAADLVHEVAPLMTQSRATRVVNRAKKLAALARETGPKLVATAKQLAADAPAIVTSLRHDAEVVRDIVASSGSSLSPMFVDLLAKAMVPPSEPEVAIDASVKVRAAKKTDETGGYKRTADAAAAAAELAEDGSSPTRSPATGRRPRFVSKDVRGAPVRARSRLRWATVSYNFFQPSARAEVEAAVRAVEQQTAAEIVVTVHPTSGTYRHADYLAGFVCALAALCVFLFHPEPFEYTFFPLELTAAFVLGAVVTAFFAPLRRLLVSRKLREKNVRTSANAAFVELGVFRTKGRTGILVYVATFEKRVVVVPDVGVDPAALGPEWEKALAALDRSVRGGPGALATALAALGPLLSRALPRQADDVNELEDAVRA